jgi:hypothetical protein
MVYLPTGGLLEAMNHEGYAQLVEQIANAPDAYIFSSYSEDDDYARSSQVELGYLLHDAGKDSVDVPLIDSQARPGHEYATLSLYGVDMERPDPSEGLEPTKWSEIYDTYERKVAEGVYEKDLQNGTVLLRGSELTNDNVNDMWDVYLNRFQWLGENHPISMEDNKFDFMKVLRSDNALCSIKFKDGKPVCFTDLIGDTDELYWLNDKFLHDADKMNLKPGQKVVFFPGIVAAAEGTHGAAEVIGLLTNVFVDANALLKVVFENTNRSESYVPRMVRMGANATGRINAETPVVIDKTIYKCTKFSAANQQA